MTCCKLLLPQFWIKSLFSLLSFSKFSTTRTEEISKFICGPALPHCCLAQGSVGCSVLYRPSPQPVSWLCTARLLLRVRRCARTRANPCTDRERIVHTNDSIRAGQFCRWTERTLPGQPCCPSQRADHSTYPECSVHTGNRKTFSRFTTAAHLPQSFPLNI